MTLSGILGLVESKSELWFLILLHIFMMLKSFCELGQGHRRVLKSGPAEDLVECRRHERGLAPSLMGGSGESPPRKF